MKTAYKDFNNNVLYTFYLPEENGAIIDNSKMIIAITTPETEIVKTIKVNNAAGFSYKLNKKSISAAGGAAGLFSFVQRCIRNDFMIDCIKQIAAV